MQRSSLNIMAVPGNGLFQPEGGLREVPQFTLSQDEGFALRDRLDKGEKITMHFKLDVPPITNSQTEYTIATLPGASDEQIVVMTHTDGYFQAAMDNAAGMASALEIARFYAPSRRRSGRARCVSSSSRITTTARWRAASTSIRSTRGTRSR